MTKLTPIGFGLVQAALERASQGEELAIAWVRLYRVTERKGDKAVGPAVACSADEAVQWAIEKGGRYYAQFLNKNMVPLASSDTTAALAAGSTFTAISKAQWFRLE